MHLALSLKESVTVEVMGLRAEVPLTGLADGCIGCCLVFKDKESAAEYAGDGGVIQEIAIVEEE